MTGASAGLGRCLCEAFAKRGARIVAVARDKSRLEQACQAMTGSAAEILPLTADVTCHEQVVALIDEVATTFGRLDVLLNNVGRSFRGCASQTSPDQFRQSIEQNLIPAVHCIGAALPLLESAQGHIVNIGSLASKFATPVMGAYPAGKFALAAYTQQLRLELGQRGIHVMLVCPGPLRRADAGTRYAAAAGLKPAALAPGGGAKLSLLDPHKVARRVVQGCEKRQAELVWPTRARWLAALQQLSPRCGDWLLRKQIKA